MMTIWIIFALMTAVVVTIVGSLLNIAREQSRLEEEEQLVSSRASARADRPRRTAV
jgi:sensor domain CHASE-containing protein